MIDTALMNREELVEMLENGFTVNPKASRAALHRRLDRYLVEGRIQVYCQAPNCEAVASETVAATINQPGDCCRHYCCNCAETYMVGRQHARAMTKQQLEPLESAALRLVNDWTCGEPMSASIQALDAALLKCREDWS